MNDRELLQALIGSAKVVLFLNGTTAVPRSEVSNTALRIVERCTPQFTAVDIGLDAERRRALAKLSAWPTIPQLYVNGELVGGSEVLVEFFRTGELQRLLHLANVETNRGGNVLGRLFASPTYIRTMECLAEAPTHVGGVSALTRLRDDLVVSGGWDASLKILHESDLRTIRTLSSGQIAIRSLCVLPAGNHVLCGMQDGRVTDHDLSRDVPPRTMFVGRGPIVAMCLLSDGRVAIARAEGGLVFSSGDIFEGEVELSNIHVTCAEALPNGRIALGCADGTLMIYDAQSRLTERSVQVHQSPILSLAVSADERFCFVGSWDYRIRSVELNGDVAFDDSVGHSGWITGLQASSDAFVSVSTDRTVRLWRRNSESIMLGSLPAPASAVVFDDTHQNILVGTAAGGVHRFGSTPSTVVQLSSHTDSVWAAATSADGAYGATGGADGAIRIWELSTGQAIRVCGGHESWVTALVFAEHRLYSASADRSIRIWDWRKGEETNCWRGHTGWVNGMSVSLSEGIVLTASADRTLILWDIATGSIVRQLVGHEAPVWSTVISRDGRLGISGAADATVRVWDLRTGAMLASLCGHTAGVTSVAVCTDPEIIVSASMDRSIRVWEGGIERSALMGHQDRVWSICMSLDGTKVVSASGDRTLKVWNPREGLLRHTIELPTGVTACCVTPDGRIALVGERSGSVRVLHI